MRPDIFAFHGSSTIDFPQFNQSIWVYYNVSPEHDEQVSNIEWLKSSLPKEFLVIPPIHFVKKRWRVRGTGDRPLGYAYTFSETAELDMNEYKKTDEGATENVVLVQRRFVLEVYNTEAFQTWYANTNGRLQNASDHDGTAAQVTEAFLVATEDPNSAVLRIALPGPGRGKGGRGRGHGRGRGR